MSMRRLLIPLFALALLVLGVARPAHAQPNGAAPSARLQLDGRDAYAGMPFTLAMVIDGFGETPAPTAPSLTIPGATVTAMGVEPKVSSRVIVIQGQRAESRSVTWIVRWRIDVAAAQTLDVPAITATQGALKASTRKANLEVKALPTTPEMAVALTLPERPVWIGEPVTAHLDWTVMRDPSDPTFVVPVFDLPDDVTLTPPKVTDPRQAITFSAGGRDVELPFVRDEVQTARGTATRFRFTFTLTPRRAGAIALPPTSVVAGLAVGRPDFFGNAATKLFRAADAPRTLEVRALPQAGRPTSFAGAVGTGFSLAVRASRSVVSLGEPVELELTVRGEVGLDTLALPRLDGDGGLPKASFTVPGDPPIGELAADGKSKVFKVAAQVVGPATEIPALALAYFDPVAQAYRTVTSEPIALSVKQGTRVGAADVVVAPSSAAAGSATAAAALPLSGSELALALSAPGSTLDAPRSGGWLWIVIGLLYAVPVGVFAARTWTRRRAARSSGDIERRAAERALASQLAAARTQPARDSVGPLVATLRTLARLAGDAGGQAALLERLEALGYSPSRGAQPLDAALLAEVDGAGRDLTRAASRRRDGATLVGLLVVGVALATAAPAHATPLEDGRAAYQRALMSSAGAEARQRAFVQATALLGEAVAAAPARPELLTDWGNAALGAGDLGTAVLAYRQALAIDADRARARQNLAWVRGRLPVTLRPASAGARDSLFFFHAWPRSRRLLVGAFMFALAVLLAVPWSRRWRRGRMLAVLPAVAWLALGASLVLERDRAADAVVMQPTLLRTADGAGAPPALASPVPAGVEVTVLESRDGWTRVALPGGQAGWAPSDSIRGVAP